MLGLGGWGGVDQKHKCMYRGKGKARGGGGGGGGGGGWESKITKSEHTYIMDDPIWKMADS